MMKKEKLGESFNQTHHGAKFLKESRQVHKKDVYITPLAFEPAREMARPSTTMVVARETNLEIEEPLPKRKVINLNKLNTMMEEDDYYNTMRANIKSDANSPYIGREAIGREGIQTQQMKMRRSADDNSTWGNISLV